MLADFDAKCKCFGVNNGKYELLQTFSTVSGVIKKGDTSISVTIKILDDSLSEGLERLRIVAEPEDLPDGHLNDVADIYIVDNEPLGDGIEVSKSSLVVYEGRAAEQFTVKLNSDPVEDVTISITVPSEHQSKITVQGPSGNAGSNATLRFTSSGANIWSSPQTVLVTALSDTDKVSERFSLALSSSVRVSANPYHQIAIAPISVKITDTTPGVSVNETRGSTVVTEDGTSIVDSYSIVIDTEPDHDITVSVGIDANANINVVGGTAGASQTLIFTGGSSGNWATPQTITVTGIDDAIDNMGSRSATITHSLTSSDSRYNAFPIRDVNVEVFDDDGGPRLFVTAPSDISEGNAGFQDREFIVEMTEPVEDYVLFDVCFSGSATIDLSGHAAISDGADYQPIFSGKPATSPFVLNSHCIASFFSPNQTTMRFVVRVRGDEYFEPDETVVVSLLIAGAPALSDRRNVDIRGGSVTFVIQDDGDLLATPDSPQVFFDKADYDVREGDAVRVSVRMSEKRDRDTEIQVNVVADPDGATPGVDFGFGNTMHVTIGKSETLGILRIPITGDDIEESTEQFTLQLSNEDLGRSGVRAGSPSTTTVSIEDIMATIHISRYGEYVAGRTSNGYSPVTEGTGASFSLTVQDLTYIKVLNINLEVSEDSNEGQDFVATVDESTKTFTINTQNGLTEIYTVPTVADSVSESDGSVTVKLLPGTGYRIYERTPSATVEVLDNDRPQRAQEVGVPIPNTQVSNLQLSTVDEDTATLTWDAVQHAQYYEVQWEVTDDLQVNTVAGIEIEVTGTSLTINHGYASATELFAKVIPGYRDANNEPLLLDALSASSTFRLSTTSTSQESQQQSADQTEITPRTVCVNDTKWGVVENYYSTNSTKSPKYGQNWYRVLIAYRLERTNKSLPTWVGSTTTPSKPYTVREAEDSESVWRGWTPIRETIECLAKEHPQLDSLPQKPTISLSAGSDLEEGESATFTLNSSAIADSDLKINVSVTQNGDWLSAPGAGTRTLTMAKGASSVDFAIATEDDNLNESDGSVSVVLLPGTDYTVAASPNNVAVVAVRDNDEPSISVMAGADVVEGSVARFTVIANPHPAAPLGVSVSVSQSGEFVDANSIGSRTVTVPISGSTTVSVVTTDDTVDESDGSISVAIESGSGYSVAAAPDNSATLTISDNDSSSQKAIGTCVSDSKWDLVDHYYSINSRKSPNFGENWYRVLIAYREERTDKALPKWVGDTNQPTKPYTVKEAKRGETVWGGWTPVRKVLVCLQGEDSEAQNGVPVTISVNSASVDEGPGEQLIFSVQLSAAASEIITVDYASRDGTAVSGEDYASLSGTLTFQPSELIKEVRLTVYDDALDEGSETVELVLSNAQGASIERSVGIGTIANTDPMPTVWLGHFGSTVAEHALDGIRNRIQLINQSSEPTGESVLQGSIGSFQVGGAPITCDVSEDTPEHASQADFISVSALKPPRESCTSQQMAGRPNRSGLSRGRSTLSAVSNRGVQQETMSKFELNSRVDGISLIRHTPNVATGQQSVNLKQLLNGSHFSYTNKSDSQKRGTVVVWGRGSQSLFEGQSRGLIYEGEVLSATLGVDYQHNDLLLGVALLQSDSTGTYQGRNSTVASEADFMFMDGDVDASLTATIPYAAWQATDRVTIWGATGRGTGALKHQREDIQKIGTEIDWRVAASGVRAELFDSSGGMSLLVISDGMWSNTASESAPGVVSTTSDTSRIRVGLEGSRRFSRPNGGSVTPTVEIAARQDSGSVMQGHGVDLAGKFSWLEPRLNLVVDVEAKTLLTHEDGHVAGTGFSFSATYDPRPDSTQGVSFSLKQSIGGVTAGGMDALFANQPMSRNSSVDDSSRWSLEIGYGQPLFNGRFIGRPMFSVGESTRDREFGVGWQLQSDQVAKNTDLSFKVHISRRANGHQGSSNQFIIEATLRL